MAAEKKEDLMPQIEHYRAVLEDLRRQRDMLTLKVNEIDKAISSLHRLIPEEAKQELPPPDFANASKPQPIMSGKYAGMGVRWAILNLMAEDANGPMPTGEIATALKAGGITSTAASFAGNVSAVLSVMSKQRSEVLSTENGWVISPVGRQVWAHIRAKREQQQLMISPNVQ